MARLIGVNLTGAVVEGWLTRAELGEMVDRCQACPASETCTRWLGTHISAPALPAFCPNKSALEALVPH